MANQYSRLNRTNILRKVNRQRNPVKSMTQLAHEFGVNTAYTRSDGSTAQAAPASFRRRVKSAVGISVYNGIRDSRSVNLSYR